MENLIGNRIHKLLKENNISQRVLAKRIGSTEASVSRYINGTRTPDARTINKIAKALNVSTDTLLMKENKKNHYLTIRRLIDENIHKLHIHERIDLIRRLSSRI